MTWRHFLGFTISLIAGICSAQPPFPTTCPGGRGMPFAAIAMPHPVDQSCGLKGKLTSPAATQVQNSVKNNFCAQRTPEVFTPQMFKALQANTHVAGGRGMEPSNRTPLTSLGEGKVVVLKAFIIEAHHADLGSGESVNCNLGDEEGNDARVR